MLTYDTAVTKERNVGETVLNNKFHFLLQYSINSTTRQFLFLLSCCRPTILLSYDEVSLERGVTHTKKNWMVSVIYFGK